MDPSKTKFLYNILFKAFPSCSQVVVYSYLLTNFVIGNFHAHNLDSKPISEVLFYNKSVS